MGSPKETQKSALALLGKRIESNAAKSLENIALLAGPVILYVANIGNHRMIEEQLAKEKNLEFKSRKPAPVFRAFGIEIPF